MNYKTIIWTYFLAGWQILDGKIVEGHIPPNKILPYSTGKFSVSGRDSTAVATKGWKNMTEPNNTSNTASKLCVEM